MFGLKRVIVGLVFALSCVGAWGGQTTLFASAARTASANGADIIRTSERGIQIVISMTAVPGVDTVTFTVQGKDNVGIYYTLLVSAAIVANSTVVLTICPGCAVTANVSANTIIPDVYRVITTHSAGTSFTYTVTENNTP